MFFIFQFMFSCQAGIPVWAKDNLDVDEFIRETEEKIENERKAEKAEKKRLREMTPVGRAMERTQKKFSHNIFNFSDSIDTFFSNERSIEESNGSRIKLGYEVLFVEFHEPRHRININTRL
ncbi:MAG: hypothetical protein KDD22_04205, partial [Bdellovibrionales bacterium]|nr:hypothetical protein [Bdellovibrionales bacterium]